MKTRTVAAWAAVLMLGNAGGAFGLTFTQTATGFDSAFEISGIDPVGFGSANQQFEVDFSNPIGQVDFEIPVPDTYRAVTNVDFAVDFIPGGGAEFQGNPLQDTTTVDLGPTGITGANLLFDFDNGIFTSDGTGITGGSFSTGYSGQTNIFSLILGFPFLVNAGTGVLDVEYEVNAGGIFIDVTDNPLDWGGFEFALAALDGLPASDPSAADGVINGTVQVDGTVVLSTVPEPTSLAIVTLGLAGLGVARRRRAQR